MNKIRNRLESEIFGRVNGHAFDNFAVLIYNFNNICLPEKIYYEGFIQTEQFAYVYYLRYGE